MQQHLFQGIQDIQVEGLVQEADRCINAVALSIIPSVRFRDDDQHNQESPNSPTSPVSSSEPHPQPSTSTLSGSNAKSNPPDMQHVHGTRANLQSVRTVHSSFSQQLPSEPLLEPPSPTSTLHGSYESNSQPSKPFRKCKGHHPETTVSPVNLSEYIAPYQPQPGVNEGSSSDVLYGDEPPPSFMMLYWRQL